MDFALVALKDKISVMKYKYDDTPCNSMLQGMMVDLLLIEIIVVM